MFDETNKLLERIAYDPCGEARHHAGGWPADLNGDGMVTTQEDHNVIHSLIGKTIVDGDYNVDADLNRDGVIDNDDYQMALAQGTKARQPRGVLSAQERPTAGPTGEP